MFYENLKKICEKKGIKMTPLVKECGAATSAIGGWKNGSAPRADIIMSISTRLNVSTDYLLFGKDFQITQYNEQFDGLSEDERDLLARYKALDDDGKKCVIVEAIHQAQRMDRKNDKKITSSSFRENGMGDNITA